MLESPYYWVAIIGCHRLPEVLLPHCLGDLNCVLDLQRGRLAVLARRGQATLARPYLVGRATSSYRQNMLPASPGSLLHNPHCTIRANNTYNHPESSDDTPRAGVPTAPTTTLTNYQGHQNRSKQETERCHAEGGHPLAVEDFWELDEGYDFPWPQKPEQRAGCVFPLGQVACCVQAAKCRRREGSISSLRRLLRAKTAVSSRIYTHIEHSIAKHNRPCSLQPQ